MKSTILIKQALEDAEKKFWYTVKHLADKQFEFAVKPWLVKEGYIFETELGTWTVYVPHTGKPLSRSEIPNNVLDVLEIKMPLYDQELGTIMPCFPED